MSINMILNVFLGDLQKQPSRGILKKSCSENMQQIYRRTPIRSVISIKLLCNFTEIALRHGCSPLNLLHILNTQHILIIQHFFLGSPLGGGFWK